MPKRKRYVFVGKNNERLSLEAETKDDAIAKLASIVFKVSHWVEVRVRKAKIQR